MSACANWPDDCNDCQSREVCADARPVLVLGQALEPWQPVMVGDLRLLLYPVGGSWVAEATHSSLVSMSKTRLAKRDALRDLAAALDIIGNAWAAGRAREVKP